MIKQRIDSLVESDYLERARVIEISFIMSLRSVGLEEHAKQGARCGRRKSLPAHIPQRMAGMNDQRRL